jgi:hypothetical protein
MAVTVTSQPGRYITDFRFEVAWAPGRTLARVGALWPSVGSLGFVAGTDRSPLPTLFFGAVRAAGAEPWLAQRMWHAVLLTLAATGTVAVARFFRAEIGWWHCIAGFTYMFSPVGIGLLLPSPIYAVYAVAPWVVASLLHGATNPHASWAWPALAALCLYFVAPVELPGTLYLVGLLPLFAILLVHDDRAPARAVVRWGLQTSCLVVPGLVYILVRSQMARGALERRLYITESPEAVASSTSWSETFRGLGHWLTYFRFGLTEPRPNFSSWLESPIVVLATFAVPLIAALALVLRPWRWVRLLFLIGALDLVIVVGFHPVGDPGPWGQLVRWLYDVAPPASSMRNTLKAGWVWALVIALLFGLVTERAIHWFRRRFVWSAAAAGACAVGLVVLGATPAFSGNLYPRSGVTEIPDYWQDAFDWLEAAPGTGSVIVLPGAAVASYRWGEPGDDIFEAFMPRPFLNPTVYQATGTAAGNLLFELNQHVADRDFQPRDLVPVLRRLGVRYILVRNDLFWQRSGLPRPATLDQLRSSPQLRLVASFGDPGENTLGPSPQRASSLERFLRGVEAQLPPVEIYELATVLPLPRVQTARSPLIVAGDGAAWTQLARAGMLESGPPIAYLSRLDDGQLLTALQRGSPVVITDTNARRRVTSSGLSANQSAPVFDRERTGSPSALFEAPGSVTTEYVPDALRIGSLEVAAEDPASRPSLAFDQRTETAWRPASLISPIGQGVTIDLREPTAITGVSVRTADLPRRLVTAVFVQADGGERVVFPIADGVGSVNLDGIEAERLTVGIAAVVGFGRTPIGFSEVEVQGLDLLVERKVPAEIFARAEANPRLAQALARAPLAYLFAREVGDGAAPIEVNLRRLFVTSASRSFSIRGAIELAAGERVAAGCVPWLAIDGVTVPVRIISFPSGIERSVDFESCEPVRLDSGEHTLAGTSFRRLNRVELRQQPSFAVTTETGGGALTVLRSAADELALLVPRSPNAQTVLTGRAFHPGWSATLEGVPIRVVELDTQAALIVPAGRGGDVVLTFGGQRSYGAALAVAGAMTLLGLHLLARRPIEWAPGWVSVAIDATTGRYDRAAFLVALVVAYLAGGPLLALAAMSAAAIGYAVSVRVVGVLCYILLGVAAVSTLLEADLLPSSGFATDRPVAGGAARLGVVCLAVAISLRRGSAFSRCDGLRGVAGRERHYPASAVLLALGVASAVAVLASAALGGTTRQIGAILALPFGGGVTTAFASQSADVVVAAPVHMAGALGPLSLGSLGALGIAGVLMGMGIAQHRVPLVPRFALGVGVGALVLVLRDPVAATTFGLVVLGGTSVRRSSALGHLLGAFMLGAAVAVMPEAALAVVAWLVIIARTHLVTWVQVGAVFLGTLIPVLAWWRWIASNFRTSVVIEAVDVLPGVVLTIGCLLALGLAALASVPERWESR